jgi:hypothetical protein
MRSARERTVWTLAVVALVAGAAVAWWKADQWLPQAIPWVEKAWGRLMRPGDDSLPPEKKGAQGATGARGAASAPAPQLRKCIQGGRTVYTDEACPPDSQEQKVDRGAVTSLPRAP